MIFSHRFASVAFGTVFLTSLAATASVPSTSSFLAPLGLTAPAEATPRYVPPTNRGTPTRTQGGGSRGCDQAMPVSFTLLIPNDHVGLTASARPTFLWYSSAATSVPMKFTLVEPGVSAPIATQEIASQKMGINQLTLPESAPELQPGRKYRWTVSQICNTKRPSNNAYGRGWIERITLSSEQTNALAAATSDQTRANILAQAGVWYDAIATMTKAVQAEPDNLELAESLTTLMEQVGLTSVALNRRPTP